MQRFQRRLGLAVALALTGIGLGSGIVPPLAQALISHYGWRSAYVALGALAVVIGVPAAWVATRHHSAVARKTREQPADSVLPLVRTRPFVLICLVFFLLSTASIGTLSHLVPMLTDRGLSPAAAARIMGLTGISTLISTAVVGWALDRVHAPYVLCVSSLCLGGSCLLLALSQTLAASVAATIVLGLFVGSEVDYITFLIRKYFAPPAFGRLYGLSFSAFVLGPGAVVLGYSYDHYHLYRPGLLLFVLLAVLAAALALGCRAMNEPVRTELSHSANATFV